jgi:3-deoxy-D-manno-octulosonic-acid transferase
MGAGAESHAGIDFDHLIAFAHFAFHPAGLDDHIFAQSAGDAARFQAISPAAAVETTGNLKFDQDVPEDLPVIDLKNYFADIPAPEIVLAASTHPGEEALLASIWPEVAAAVPAARLVIVPRHAERGREVQEIFERNGFSVIRRSECKDPSQLPPSPDTAARTVVADTTGEMLSLMQSSAIVIMGKSFAGQDEGHNLLEPALLGKPTVTGKVLKNFRFVLQVLKDAEGIITAGDEELPHILTDLLQNPQKASEYGARASAAMAANRGAAARIINVLSAE